MIPGVAPLEPPLGRFARHRQAAGTALGLTFARYVNVGLGLLSNALLARSLGPADYGFVIALISVQAAGGLIAEWSTEQFVIRQVSRSTPDLAAPAVASAARLRLLIGPLPGLILILALMATRSDLIGGEVIAAIAVWASALLGFSSLAPPALLAAGHTRRFVAIAQVPGLLWSAGAIAVAVFHPTVTAAGLVFGITGLATGICYIVGSERVGISVLPARRDEGPSPMALLRELTPSAVAQMSLLAPWRLIPPVVAAVVAPVPAGLALAGLRYWEQVAVPAIAVAQVQVGRVARGGRDEMEAVLRHVLAAIAGMLLVGIPGAFLYVRFVLGTEYSDLQRIVVAGAGIAMVAGLSQALVPVLLTGGLVREARRIGVGSVCSLVPLVGLLAITRSVAATLAAVTLLMGCGLLISMRVNLGRSLRMPDALLTVTGLVLCLCALIPLL